MKRNLFANELRRLVKKRISSENIFDLYPLFLDSGLSVKAFAIKQGFKMKESIPKRYNSLKPKQTKPKTQKQARKFSIKRAKKESSLILARQAKFEHHNGVCDGCGRCGLRLSCSHRISKADDFDLIDDPNNLDMYCNDCHENVELGYYNELKNADEVKKYIQYKRPDIFKRRYKPNKNDSN